MGVPKFYRWISERYPCLSEVIREYQIPEFDNLYLDMNGIIHNCSHPNDDDVHFRISESQIFQDIFRYIEFLFRMIKPRKVFFMAIDGVAPRAKMNQQRGRRFRSAKEAEKKEEEARKKGEVLPTEARFDSNCITPGTEFMDRLHQGLKWFIANKISTDDLWKDVTVILSGHETPGEGEHKIMDYIRYERSRPGYDPNTRHCLYGLDADLIVLGMASHEPHFSLLREEVKFLKTKRGGSGGGGGQGSSASKEAGQTAVQPVAPKPAVQRTVNPDVITFHLLHLSLLRDYLDLEFGVLRHTLSKFDYDLEHVIDDWILMGFLVGNDFIPHLPHFHINKNSLTLLYQAYVKVLPNLDGYLNEDGKLNLLRFEEFLKEVSEMDVDTFKEVYADLKYFEEKCTISKGGRGGKVKNNEKDLVPYYDEGDAEIVGEIIDKSDGKFSLFSNNGQASASKTSSGSKRNAATGGIQTVSQLLESSSSPEDNEDIDDDDLIDDVDDIDHDSEDDSEDEFGAEFRLHKDNYYETKLEYQKVDESVLRDQAEGYIRALQWNLHYYYNGCVSWSWFYPHHYAPYISDVKNFASSVDVTFDLGKPFKPFEQLLAVLPAASKQLLPKSYQRLVTDSKSPLISNYPTEFELDMNEKMQDWEAVVKIPFIDEKSLLEAAAECSLLFSANEKERNKHGPHIAFTFNPDESKVTTYSSPYPAIFPDIIKSRATITHIDVDHYRIDPRTITKGLLPGAKLPGRDNIHFPGFPTLSFVKLGSAQLKKDKVRVFEQPSNGDNMVLEITPFDPVSGEPVINNLSKSGPSRSNECDGMLQLAVKYLGSTIFVNWPHLIEARVDKITDFTTLYYLDKNATNQSTTTMLTLNNNNIPQETSVPNNAKAIKTTKLEHVDLQNIMDNFAVVSRVYKERKGISLGQTYALLIVSPLTGRRYVPSSVTVDTSDGPKTKSLLVLQKQWSNKPLYAPIQTVVPDVEVYDPGYESKYKTLDDVFTIGSRCFVLAPQYYGCPAEVISLVSDDPSSTDPSLIRVKITCHSSEPDLSEVREREMDVLKDEYDANYVLAQKLGMSGHVLSRFLGSIFVRKSGQSSGHGAKVNIGLSLRFNSRNEEIPGFSKKQGDTWLFSTKVQEMMEEYLEKFPSVIRRVADMVNKDTFDVEDIFGGNPDGNTTETLQNLMSWLRSLPCYRATRQKVGAQVLEPCVVKYVEKLLNTHFAMEEESKEIELNLKPQLLYKPLHFLGYSLPDPNNGHFNIYDRVVNVRSGISVPLGLRGVIIGIHEETENDLSSGQGTGHVNTIYDVLFDEEFPGGVALRCSTGRGYKMHPASLLNLEIGRGTKLKRKQPNEHLIQSLQPQGNRNNAMNKRYDVNNFVSNHQQNVGGGHHGRPMGIQFDGQQYQRQPVGNQAANGRKKRIEIGELTSAHSSRQKPNRVDHIARNPSPGKQKQQVNPSGNGREHGPRPGQALFQQVKGNSPPNQKSGKKQHERMNPGIGGVINDKNGNPDNKNNLIESLFSSAKKNNTTQKKVEETVVPIPVQRSSYAAAAISQQQQQPVPLPKQQSMPQQASAPKQHQPQQRSQSLNMFIPAQVGRRGQQQKKTPAKDQQQPHSSSVPKETPKQIQILKKVETPVQAAPPQGAVGGHDPASGQKSFSCGADFLNVIMKQQEKTPSQPKKSSRGLAATFSNS